ncbi:lipoprotein signal peptidase [Prevotella sp. Rep29]|uniref:lipoprotein signal peptidase n=1 Tax=Prevotella sp. Rep29 TaxID=2691580 RepID=UPI001C6E7290|nr:lipoprotein signal peptidase [Prevotella sp. Rep29]QYR10719.1 lipoprotein signal peptidase [Prevotella sp. Rep29]
MKGRRKFLSQGWLAFGLIVIMIVIDQIIKIEVKTGMYLRESIHIADWFQILFIENNGMAYGMTFINKVVLTLFRVVVVSVIGYYIWKVLKEKVRTGYLVCLSMIFAGAIGNIFDCLFYGLIFSESTPFSVSTLVPFGEGYAPFLQGRVVDMFYFPIIDTNLPDWLPIWGGEHFIFFSPVFNFADSCISVGVVALLLFYRKELSQISLFNHKDEKADK